jgi:hypothetical protein
MLSVAMERQTDWARHRRRQLAAALFAAALSMSASVASAGGSDDLHRPLHLPHLRPGQRCPVSASRPLSSGQTLNGRGPAFLSGVIGERPAAINVDWSSPDSLGWSGQKTPWAITRSYDGPILVRGARIGRRGQMRFAYAYGDHLRELEWSAGADQGLPPDPNFRFLASATSFRVPGCYAYQIDGTSFSEVVVIRVPR